MQEINVMTKNLLKLFIYLFVFISCDVDKNNYETKKKYYYDNSNSLKSKTLKRNDSIFLIIGYDKDNQITDSVYRVKNKIIWQLNKEIYNINDTALIKIFFKDKKYSDQYLLLDDSLSVEQYLDNREYLYENVNQQIELEIPLKETGSFFIHGYAFNTDISPLKWINKNEFIGYRKGVFEEFEIELKVVK